MWQQAYYWRSDGSLHTRHWYVSMAPGDSSNRKRVAPSTYVQVSSKPCSIVAYCHDIFRYLQNTEPYWELPYHLGWSTVGERRTVVRLPVAHAQGKTHLSFELLCSENSAHVGAVVADEQISSLALWRTVKSLC